MRHHSTEATRRLVDRLDCRNLSCVAGYLASDGEIDLSKAFGWFSLKNVDVVVPYVRSGEMSFSLFKQGQRLEVGKWGIQEPDPIEDVDLECIDLFLVPVVAFSSRGDRLGRGGGYYDRTLCQVANPLIVGMAYAFQKDEGIVANTTDVPLAAVVTEEGWQLFDNRVQCILGDP